MYKGGDIIGLQDTPIMSVFKTCPVCNGVINPKENWELILDLYGDIISIADRGVEAMTEQQQMLYHNLVHAECYENLE